MLYAISIQIAEAFETRKVPYPVVYGPERMEHRSLTESHVTIMRNRGGTDTTGPSVTKSRNPKVIFHRDIAALAHVFMRSTLPGAGPGQHEQVADLVVDQLLLALYEICSARRMRWTIGSGRFLSANELDTAELQSWPGVVYELNFTIGRGVQDIGYDLAAASEATFGGVGGTTVETTLDTSDSPGVGAGLPGATTRHEE